MWIKIKWKNKLKMTVGIIVVHYGRNRVHRSVSYQAVWFSSIVCIESNNESAPISPMSTSISYGDVGPTSDGLHNPSSRPWNDSIGIGIVSYATWDKKRSKKLVLNVNRGNKFKWLVQAPNGKQIKVYKK